MKPDNEMYRVKVHHLTFEAPPILEELGFERDDLDDAGLAHRSTLDMIGIHGRKLSSAA